MSTDYALPAASGFGTSILITFTVASGAAVSNISINYSLPFPPQIANPVGLLFMLLLLMKLLSLIYQMIIHCLLPRGFSTLILITLTVASGTSVFNISIDYSLSLPLTLTTQYS